LRRRVRFGGGESVMEEYVVEVGLLGERLGELRKRRVEGLLGKVLDRSEGRRIVKRENAERLQRQVCA
jgi:hypothetical protein